MRFPPSPRVLPLPGDKLPDSQAVRNQHRASDLSEAQEVASFDRHEIEAIAAQGRPLSDTGLSRWYPNSVTPS